MRRVGGVAVLLAAARFVEATAEPTLADCAMRLERTDAEVVDACPDINAAIASSAFAGVQLSGERPSRTDIEAFASLTSSFGQSRAARTPDASTLDGILAGLQPAAGPKSLWQLFNAWVHDRWQEFVKWLPQIPNPLAGLKWHLPDWGRELLRSMGWGLVGMLTALAALGLFALMRAAKRRMPRMPDWSRTRRRAEHRSPELADLAGEPLAQQLRLLLQIVLAALRKSGRLVERSALTHRELAAAAVDLNDRERDVLESVAILAERVTYSRWEPTAGEVAAIVEQGRLLVQTGVR